MARTITEIQTQLIDNYVTTAAANGITIDPAKWSRFNLQKVWTFIVASAIALFEQVLDAKKVELETLLTELPAATKASIHYKALQWQYDPVTPQVLLFNTTTQAYYYPTVNPALCPITRCSVTTDAVHVVQIKVAQNEPPEAITTSMVNAMQAYFNTINPDGIKYVVVSNSPDRLYIAADIYYQGVYSAQILTNVTTAINAFLAAIPFDGTFNVSDLEGAMRAVTGVNDVVLNNVVAHDVATLLANGTKLVQSTAIIQRNWKTVAGYIIPETATSNTLADTLNFIAQ